MFLIKCLSCTTWFAKWHDALVSSRVYKQSFLQTAALRATMPLTLESHDTEKHACELPPTSVGSKTRKFVFTRLQLSAHIYKSIWEASLHAAHRCFITGLSCLVSLPLLPPPSAFPPRFPCFSCASLIFFLFDFFHPVTLVSVSVTRLSRGFDWTAVDVGRSFCIWRAGNMLYLQYPARFQWEQPEKKGGVKKK